MMPSNVDWFADVIKPFVSPFDGANHGIHNFSSNYCNYRPPFPVSNISNHGINYVTCISLSESIFSCNSLYFQFFELALFPPPKGDVFPNIFPCLEISFIRYNVRLRSFYTLVLLLLLFLLKGSE